MSEENKTQLLIRVKPNNADTPEYKEMLKEFQAEDVKFEGIITVPKDYTFITDEKDLLIVLPNRIDFTIALEEDEYQILTEK